MQQAPPKRSTARNYEYSLSLPAANSRRSIGRGDSPREDSEPAADNRASSLSAPIG